MSHIVLGGGISGLSAGYYLSKTLLNTVKIYESSNRVGGWIKSVRTENGSLFEVGPRTLRASQNTLELVEELGLLPSVKPVSVQAASTKSFLIYFNKELCEVHRNLGSLFRRSPLAKPFIVGLLKDLITPKATVEDDSAYNFVERRFGKDFAENLVSPLTCGIFGGDAKEISVKAIINGVFEKEQKYSKVTFGMLMTWFQKNNNQTNLKFNEKIRNWSVWGFENGLETLPIGIYNHLKKKDNIEIFLEKKCSNVEFKKGEVLITVDGNVERAEHLYSSLPSKELGKILGDEHSFLKSELLSVPFVSIAVVNLEYDDDVLRKRSYGVLVPPNQNLPVLGIVFDSNTFNEGGNTILTVMMGGKWFEQHFGTNPDKNTLLKIARDHVKLILNIDEKPTNSLVTVLEEAIPQHVVGHSKRVQGIREYIKKNKLPLTVFGNSFDGVGVNDSIMSAKKNVQNALQDLNLNVLKSLTFGNVDYNSV